MGVGAGLYMCDVVKKVHVRYLISWWVLVFCLCLVDPQLLQVGKHVSPKRGVLWITVEGICSADALPVAQPTATEHRRFKFNPLSPCIQLCCWWRRCMVLCGAELSDSVKQQYTDNIDWIKHAHLHRLVSSSTSISISITQHCHRRRHGDAEISAYCSRCTSQKISGEWRQPRERQACAPRDPFTEYSRATNVVMSTQKLPLRAKLIRTV